MSARTVDLATKSLVPRIIVESFAGLSPAVSKVLSRFGFFASRESVLTLQELLSTDNLDALVVEMQAALPPSSREEEKESLRLATFKLARLGANVLPTSSLPAELGYATNAPEQSTPPPAPPAGTKWGRNKVDSVATPKDP
eukprot:2576294-Amphidinium_carterae.2